MNWLKKGFVAFALIVGGVIGFAQVKSNEMSVQVVLPELENITGSENNWLGGQIQDKLKSNLQEYLGLKTSVDTKSEAALLKIQKESENASRDETLTIELGKITTAKFVLFSKIRKTNKGYIITADFTDLTTGEQKASVSSKEYSEIEYLYGSTGAVDELTLLLASKLNIAISDLNKRELSNGSSAFSVDEQLALAKANEVNYKKLMAQYDSELEKLTVSNDINAVENKKKIEAEKALLIEKQKAEQKKQEELAARKKRVAEDAKLEAERSIALKTQRDKMAKEAAIKAAEVRKLKIAKQGVLGQINIIESKKKALIEIRNSVEERSRELYLQLVKDRDSEELRIRNKKYSTVELENGEPTQAAKKRRENQVIKSYEDLTNKFFADCEAVKASTKAQDNALLSEIRADQKALATTRTVSSMGDELKVSFGTYEGSQNVWRAYLSLYSDGVLLYTDSFIVSYEAVSGKKVPKMETELDDAVIDEYTNNVDMYNSLLIRGEPIIYFEIDYTAKAESDDKPSTYTFDFNNIRVINTLSGNTVQTTELNKTQLKTIQMIRDLREFAGVMEKEKARFNATKYPVENAMSLGLCRSKAEKAVEILGVSRFIPLPNKKLTVLSTEITQKTYKAIIGNNPSYFKGENNPVEMVSFGDVIYFCNKMSKEWGLEPVYSVKETTDIAKWEDIDIYNTEKNDSANGFRLPTLSEWNYAAKGGENYKYSGSDDINEVCWYKGNSDSKTHPVAQKKANGYGLYDISGNVSEWIWEFDYCSRGCFFTGGCYDDVNSSCEVNPTGYHTDYKPRKETGFRIVFNTPNIAGWLGVSLKNAENGVLIEKVFEDSPAKKFGIKESDIVTGFNGHKIENYTQLSQRIGSILAGTTVTLTAIRSGKTFDINVTLSERP